MDAAPPTVERPRRNHRVITAPAGLLLFACLFLPGYSECGHGASVETTGSSPWFIGVGVVGLLVAVAAWRLAGRVGEMFAAVAGIIASAVALLMTVFYILLDHALVGMYLTSASAVGLLCGSIVWVTEAGDHRREAQRSRAIRIVGAGIVAIYVIVALVAPRDVDGPEGFPTGWMLPTHTHHP